MSTSCRTSGPPNSCCWMARMCRTLVRARTVSTVLAPMSLTVVGSIAFDAVKTPSGARERMLGGAATHFALAASFFDEVRVVGPVGDDFDEDAWRVLRTRGHDHRRRRARRRAARPSSGRASTTTTSTRARRIETDLNVFEDFEPKLSDAARATATSCSWPTSSPTSSAACASSARARASWRWTRWTCGSTSRATSLEATIRGVDCLILNDEELELLTGKPTVAGGRRRRS